MPDAFNAVGWAAANGTELGLAVWVALDPGGGARGGGTPAATDTRRPGLADPTPDGDARPGAPLGGGMTATDTRRPADGELARLEPGDGGGGMLGLLREVFGMFSSASGHSGKLLRKC